MTGSSRGAVGFIGLGVMSSRMARHLGDDGRELAVYDARSSHSFVLALSHDVADIAVQVA